jgi:hypothetical protein
MIRSVGSHLPDRTTPIPYSMALRDAGAVRLIEGKIVILEIGRAHV